MRSLDTEIWEGWTINDFIKAIDLDVAMMMRIRPSDKKGLKKYVMDAQPYYKKHIPEVYDHYVKKYFKEMV